MTFWYFFVLFPNFQSQNTRQSEWRTRKNINIWLLLLLLPPILWLLNLAIQKVLKRSANDENWRDCYYTINKQNSKQNSSASGEVRVSYKMAEKLQIGFCFNFRIWSVSDLDKEDMFLKQNIASNHHRNVDKERHNCK